MKPTILVISIIFLLCGCKKPWGFKEIKNPEYLSCKCYADATNNYKYLDNVVFSFKDTTIHHVALTNSDVDSIISKFNVQNGGCNISHNSLTKNGKKYIVGIVYNTRGSEVKYFKAYKAKKDHAIVIKSKITSSVGGSDMNNFVQYYIVSVSDTTITNLKTTIKLNETGGLLNHGHDQKFTIDGI